MFCMGDVKFVDFFCVSSYLNYKAYARDGDLHFKTKV